MVSRIIITKSKISTKQIKKLSDLIFNDPSVWMYGTWWIKDSDSKN